MIKTTCETGRQEINRFVSIANNKGLYDNSDTIPMVIKEKNLRKLGRMFLTTFDFGVSDFALHPEFKINFLDYYKFR